MRNGVRIPSATSLVESRHYCQHMTDALPPSLLTLESTTPYPVQPSDALAASIR
jgi:hypothetical protein